MKSLNFTSKLFLSASLVFNSLFASAQVIETPTQLAAACLSAPGNVLVLNQSIKVSLPQYPNSPTVANCPCTIVLNNQSKFETEQVNMQFAGAFTVQSTGKGEIQLSKSSIVAPSISFNLGGESSAVQSSESFLQANAGNLTMTLGTQAKLELYSRRTTFAPNSLQATGIINLSGGRNLTAAIQDMGVRGDQGVTVSASGAECLLKLEKAVFRSQFGSASVLANGTKSLLEAIESGFYVKNSTTINYSASESFVKLNEIFFGGYEFASPMTGGVTIVAGAAGTSFSKLEMADIKNAGTINGGFSATAGMGGQYGGVKMEKSNLTVGGNIKIATDNWGNTEVKENRLTSSTQISISTGANGTCISTPNFNLTAPVVITCAAARPVTNLNNNANVIASIGETIEQSELRVFPNPSSQGQVFVKMGNESQDNEVSVFDLQGRLVQKSIIANEQSISTSEMSSGMYTIKVLNTLTNSTKTSKLIVE